MTDHLDLEAIKVRASNLWPDAMSIASLAHEANADVAALISEVERLQADVERKDEALRRVRTMLIHDSRATTRAAPTETKGENG